MRSTELWGLKWLDTFAKVDDERKVALLLGKGVEEHKRVLEVEEDVVNWFGKWQKELLYGEIINGFLVFPPLSP